METFGKHLLVEYHGCDTANLDKIPFIEKSMRAAAEFAGATVVTSTFHQFSPQGVSGVVVIEESHLSIHTWPECGYAAVDFYTCGDCLPIRAHEHLARSLGAQRWEIIEVQRGLRKPGASMQVRDHYIAGVQCSPLPVTAETTRKIEITADSTDDASDRRALA